MISLLASYPKSGSTWLRFILAYYFYEEYDVDWDISQGRIKLTKFDADQVPASPSEFNPLVARPAFIKTHGVKTANGYKCQNIKESNILESLVFNKKYLIVRNPMDVIISYVAFEQRNPLGLRHFKTDLTEAVDRFKNQGLLPNYTGKWDEYHNAWLDNADVTIIRYENLLVDSFNIVSAVLEENGVTVNTSKLSSAIAATEFNKLKQLEQKSASEKARKEEPKQQTNPDSQNYTFFRHGKKGTYKNVFTAEQKNQYLETFGPTMIRLGYNLEDFS